MSIEVLLIPIGITAVAALKESLAAGQYEKWATTRIAEVDILLEALPLMGATVIGSSAERVTADSAWGVLTFQKMGAAFLARTGNGSDESDKEMLAELDAVVGRIMQARTAQIVVERARALGFNLIEQRNEDGSLNYLFEEMA